MSLTAAATRPDAPRAVHVLSSSRTTRSRRRLAPTPNVTDDVCGVGGAVRARPAGFPSAASHAAWPRPVQRAPSARRALTRRDGGGCRRCRRRVACRSETLPPTAPPPRVEWTKKAPDKQRDPVERRGPRRSPEWGNRHPPNGGRTSRTRRGGGGKIKRLPSVDNTVMRKKAGCYIGRHEWLGFRRPGGERYSACRYCLAERSVTPRRGGGRSRDVDGAEGDQPVDRGADASGARDQTSAAA